MSPARKWNPWPWAITAWFVFFIALCVGFVIRSLSIRHDLVSGNYYVEGLEHDQRQAARHRARQLPNPPRIELDAAGHRLIVRIPSEVKGGVLTLYRPSDSRLDLKFALQEGVPSVVSTQDIHPGKWQAKIHWQLDGLDYYHQEDLFIP